jgi:hypothetical protein
MICGTKVAVPSVVLPFLNVMLPVGGAAPVSVYESRLVSLKVAVSVTLAPVAISVWPAVNVGVVESLVMVIGTVAAVPGVKVESPEYVAPMV